MILIKNRYVFTGRFLSGLFLFFDFTKSILYATIFLNYFDFKLAFMG